MNKVKIGFPIEYEDENNISRKGLLLRKPEIKELEKRLKEINKIINLEQQCKKQKQAIDKINNFCKDDKNFEILDLYSQDSVYEIQEKLLDILKEVEND